MCDLTLLPPVLVNIVMGYAYNVSLDSVKDSLGLYMVLKSMRLPFFFYRDTVWNWHDRIFHENPLKVFLPIEYFGGRVRDLFDDDAMYCFLLGLDFRKRKVRMFGSRERWLHRLNTNWCTVEPFAAYYRMLMRSEYNVMKKRTENILKFI